MFSFVSAHLIVLPVSTARADETMCGTSVTNLQELNAAIAEFTSISPCNLIEIGEDFEIERIDPVLEPIAPIVIDPTGSPTAIAKSLTIDGNMHVLTGIGFPSGFVVYLAKGESPFVLTVRNLGMSGFGGSGALAVISDATIVERSLFRNNQFQTSPNLPNFEQPEAGAVSALGKLTIEDSEFENNRGSNGGAVFNATRPIELGLANGASPPLVISGSTFAANDAAAVGGAISTEQSLIMTNSTLTGNTAGSAGGVNVVGSATFNFCTIVGNTSSSNRAAVSATLDVSIFNSIVYGNGPQGLVKDVSADGTLTITSSLVTSSTTIESILFATALDNSNIIDQDPLLAALGEYSGFTLPGGTTIQTRPPQTGSPVIDTIDLLSAGNDDGPTDQRGSGFPRIVNRLADMGAVEYWPVVVPETPTDSPYPLPDFSDYSWSLNVDRQTHLPNTR